MGQGEAKETVGTSHQGQAVVFKKVPDEVSNLIFSFLPGKAIGRCECVCRSWHALISGEQELQKLKLADWWPRAGVLNPQKKYSALRCLASREQDRIQLDSPVGVAVAGDGQIFVLDRNAKRVVVFDHGEDHPTKSWETAQQGDSPTGHPCGIALDGEGNIILADEYPARIQTFSKEGTLVRSFQLSDSPQGVAVDCHGNILISDVGQSLTRYSPVGECLDRIAKKGSGGDELQFGSLRSVAVDRHGRMVVVDSKLCQINVLAPDGTFLHKFGSHGTKNGQFEFPHGVAVDGKGRILVADINRHCVQVFSDEGIFLMKMGTFGSGASQLNSPYAVAVDHHGYVIIADSQNSRVQVFGYK